MIEQEINQKLKAHYKDKASIEANIAELEKQKTALSKKWIAATASFIAENDRLVLNLSSLSGMAKEHLREALTENYKWISFNNNGEWGADSVEYSDDRFSFYSNAKVIF